MPARLLRAHRNNNSSRYLLFGIIVVMKTRLALFVFLLVSIFTQRSTATGYFYLGVEPLVRIGLAQYIATHDDLQVSAEAGSGDEAIQLVRKQEFDVVVLDISMPDKNGIDTLHVIKRIKPDLHVLVLSGHAETHYAVNTLRAGASGYVCKDAPPEEFIRAIRFGVAWILCWRRSGARKKKTWTS